MRYSRYIYYFIPFLLAFNLISCGFSNDSMSSSEPEATGLGLNLPSRLQFEPNQQELLTGFYLEITTQGTSCSTFTPIVYTQKWPTEKIHLPIQPECDYRIGIDLGSFDKRTEQLSNVYLSNRLKHARGEVLSRESNQSSDNRFSLFFEPTKSGYIKGFASFGDQNMQNGIRPKKNSNRDKLENNKDKGSGSNGDKESADGSGKKDEEEKNEDKDEVPDSAPSNLSSDQNISLLAPDGSRSPLSERFKGDYLIIDVSSAYCGYCLDLAKRHNKDKSFQELIAGDKCDYISVVPENELNSWLSKIGVNSYAADGSWGYPGGNPYRFGDLFNVRIGGTPTVFVIDRQGQAVAEQVGGLPREVSSLCQE